MSGSRAEHRLAPPGLECSVRSKPAAVARRPERAADAAPVASRRAFFETLDRPALLPLPPEPYTYAEWRRCRLAPDYHVQGFHAGKRAAAHPPSVLKRRQTTTPEHMPSAHPRYPSWTPARIQSLADNVGPGTRALG